MPLRTLIVDDEPIARNILREELELIGDIAITGEAGDGRTALNRIAEQRPDLVLLDLQMPEIGGLDVVRNIRGGIHLPVIVIVTAYDEFALKAFEVGAIDYLLKPVSLERLRAAVDRARHLSGSGAADHLVHLQEFADSPAGPRNRRIVGKAGEEFFLLNTEEICAFQAEGEIVWIMTATKRYVATQTLKALEERLKSSGFERIHRNALVNVDQVRKMSALSSQRWLITLSNNQEFIASKRLARGIRQLLNS